MDGVNRIGPAPVLGASKLLSKPAVTGKELNAFYDIKTPHERLDASAKQDVREAYSVTSQVLLSNPVVANEYAEKPRVTLNSYGALLPKPTYKRLDA